jgi:hypothetical protein
VYFFQEKYFSYNLKDDLNLMFNHIYALINLKCVKPVVGKIYPLEEAAEAQSDVINNTGSVGRLTLQVV